jgi:SAM-dependent methyltransferase
VGTGRGEFIETLREHLGGFDSFTGIDVNQEDLEKAGERLKGSPVQLIRMDGKEMSFDDHSFDTVCVSHSLHHLENVGPVLAEMVRVLRPGGTFIVQEMFSDGEQTQAQLTDIRVHHWNARVDRLLGTFHRRTYTRGEIMATVRPLGLLDVRSFETTHSLRCLTCEDRFKCEDPLAPDLVKGEIEDIETNLGKLEACGDHRQAHELAEEGRALMDLVRETGIASASTLFVMGRKG